MPKPEHKKLSAPFGVQQSPPALSEVEGVAARFSAAASTYHPLADIQRRVARKLMTLLPAAPAPLRILEIGCGTGVLTEMLAHAFPSAVIDAVDVAPAMTLKARGNLTGNKMINWIIADACRLPESMKYPLIMSNCALHWITPIELIIAKLGALLEQNGRLAFAMMLRGTLAELNSVRKSVAPHKPPRIVLPRHDEVKNALAEAGFLLQTEETEEVRLEYRSVSGMLKQLHDQGLTGGNIPGKNALLTRSEIFRLIADYSENYKDKNGVYATYRVLYCVAGKEM